jgi:hypothetical protein
MDRLRFHAYIYASKPHWTSISLTPGTSSASISSPDAVVLDYACGERYPPLTWRTPAASLFAEPAPGVRGRLIARFAPNKIRVRSLDDVRKMAENSLDLVVMNSVAIHDAERTGCCVRRDPPGAETLWLASARRYPAPEVGMARDVLALLKFADPRVFEKDVFTGS